MDQSPERRAPRAAGGTRPRLAGRSRAVRFSREGPGTVRERGSATAGAAWAGSTNSEQSSGCVRVVNYDTRQTKLSNQVYTLSASRSAGKTGNRYCRRKTPVAPAVLPPVICRDSRNFGAVSRPCLPDESPVFWIKRSLAWRLPPASDRKSTRLNSSHLGISYAVFCLKKKKKT